MSRTRTGGFWNHLYLYKIIYLGVLYNTRIPALSIQNQIVFKYFQLLLISENKVEKLN